MDEIACTQCPWHDARPSTASTPNTCPNCGGNVLTRTPQEVVEERRRGR